MAVNLATSWGSSRDNCSKWRLLVSTMLVSMMTVLLFIVTRGLYTFFVLYQPRHLVPGPARLCDGCNSSPVPRILHHTWVNRTVPAKWRQTYQSCVEQHQGYKHMLWTDEELEKFLEKEYSWFMPTYWSYPYNIERVDAARYFLLYHFGGVYIDMDMGCNISTDAILSNLTDYNVLLSATTPTGVTNQYMASTPRHPLFRHAIYQLSSANRWYVTPYPTIIFSTGPMFLTVRLSEKPSLTDVYILPVKQVFTKYFWRVPGNSWHRWDSYVITTMGDWIENGTLLYLMSFTFCMVVLAAAFTCRRRLSQKRCSYALLENINIKISTL